MKTGGTQPWREATAVPVHETRSTPVIVEHPGLEGFEPLLDRVLDIAHTSGIQALAQAGLRLDDIKTRPSAHRRFLRGCHYGFDLAQRRVTTAVIDLEEKARSLTGRLRGNADEAKDRVELLRAIQTRQRVLRRLIDSILWQILYPDERALRYFAVDNRLRPIDPPVLMRMAGIAHHRNREDRLKFNVVSDLTTAVHIGDLVEVDRTNLTKTSWRVVELKEGKMNAMLSSSIEERGGALSEQEFDILRTVHGDAAARQARRMLRQRAREESFRSIMETDHGLSPQYQMPVHVSPEREYTGSYMDAILQTSIQAKQHGVATTTVDGCLRLLAAKPGHRLWPKDVLGAVMHCFYHIGEQVTECVLGDPAQSKAELAAVREIPPVVDLIAHNMHDPLGTPIFLLPNLEIVKDLIMRRLRVFVQFDFRRFFEQASLQGIKLSWASRKDTESYKKLSGIIPGSPGSYGVRVTIPGAPEQILLGGFFRRVIGDFTLPRDLLKMIKQYPRQLEQMAQSGGHDDKS